MRLIGGNCQMSASTEQMTVGKGLAAGFPPAATVNKRLTAGFSPGLTIYGIPTTTNTAFNVPADMASDTKPSTAANMSVQMRANMVASCTIDDSSDDHRHDYSFIQCLSALINRLHLLGVAKNPFVGLCLTSVLYSGALPTRFYSRAGE